eukprot:TRINITY_DN867_c3_g1_i4.p1 TRINITY_DN867_c3_g1~~TRINITY_DN867_c3_g1_i4.p1  ORF type:complete len:138 (-),score=18.89 TRINITY_DN867_c3_g1_i4:432-845(-)
MTAILSDGHVDLLPAFVWETSVQVVPHRFEVGLRGVCLVLRRLLPRNAGSLPLHELLMHLLGSLPLHRLLALLQLSPRFDVLLLDDVLNGGGRLMPALLSVPSPPVFGLVNLRLDGRNVSSWWQRLLDLRFFLFFVG